MILHVTHAASLDELDKVAPVVVPEETVMGYSFRMKTWTDVLMDHTPVKDKDVARAVLIIKELEYNESRNEARFQSGDDAYLIRLYL